MYTTFLITDLDIDECTNGVHDCHQDADCENTAGSFTCSCEDGFAGDGRQCTGEISLLNILFPAIDHKILGIVFELKEIRNLGNEISYF